MKEIFTNHILDENLKPRYWHNKSGETHCFVSKLKTFYPQAKEERERIYAPPGQVTFLPHNYWVIETRDSGPAKGAWVHGEMVEGFAPKSLSHGSGSV